MAEAVGGNPAADPTGNAVLINAATTAHAAVVVGRVIEDRPGRQRRIIPLDGSGPVGGGGVAGPGRFGAGSAVLSHRAGKLGVMATWATGEVLGLDFETTGVDRFNDVPVSYTLVSVVDGVLVRSWSG